VIYGDNQAAVSVLSSRDGPWRTRHLRLRSHVFPRGFSTSYAGLCGIFLELC